MQDTAVDLGNVGWLLDALLELNVLVPEWVALKVESDKMSAPLKKPIRSACMNFGTMGKEGAGGGMG